MSEHPITKPNAVTYALEDIVAAVMEGKVRIPDFQRAFRWQWEDVKRLLDSIIRGYPIGSLLLWSRPAPQAKITLGALSISAPETQEALWVIDGQQRLTSLACALSDDGLSDPRFGTLFDTATQTFCKAIDSRPYGIPLPVIFDLQRLIKWFSENPDAREYFEQATRAAKAIRQYSIPAYIVKQDDESVLRDIFDRMNNYGKRLTRAEVFSALHTGSKGDGPPKNLADIIEHIDSQYGFGILDDDTALRAVLARRGSDVTRDIRLEFGTANVSREFPNDSVDDAYRGGSEALGRAVAFLQREANVPHFGFLTYRYLLVVLTRFFAHFPSPKKRNRQLLRRWFWRASIVGPEVFKGWTQAMRKLSANIIPGEEDTTIKELLKTFEQFDLRPPSIKKFMTTSASSRMLLCAMWHHGPRSLSEGKTYDITGLAQSLAGQSTAKNVVKTILRRGADSAMTYSSNRYFLLEDDIMEDPIIYFTQPPLNLSPEKWKSICSSHIIDDAMMEMLASGRGAEFLNLRELKLVSLTNDFLERMTEKAFEDTPPLESLIFDDDEDNDEHFNESLS